MNILLAASEAVPYAKTGGLADVSGALPLALQKAGHQVALIMPAYRSTLKSQFEMECPGIEFTIPIGQKTVAGSLLKSYLPGSQVPVYFVRQDHYFERDQLYTAGKGDYVDNCERFVFFSRAVLESIRLLNLEVDVLHCNDWQTGLIPVYLKTLYRHSPQYQRIVSLLTVHNLAYQGTFWHWDMLLTGLDWKYFNWHQLEFFGNLNLLKAGLVFADAINTVSPRYAQEIQSSPLGCGLEGVLQQRRSALTGIVNGADYDRWNPACDDNLPVRYDATSVVAGKAACKAALQRELNLPVEPRTPLLAFVGRMVEQKGIDQLIAVIQDWVQQGGAQWVLLGTGHQQFEEAVATLAQRNPRMVAARLDFSEPLAHRIEAAADIFLMPSQFEPCGLSQLYSLKYGTVPIVRSTGGLADTITDVNDETLAAGTATGFVYQEHSALALSQAIRRACNHYQDTAKWTKIIAAGMAQDWSWDKSAQQYTALYQQMIARLPPRPVTVH